MPTDRLLAGPADIWVAPEATVHSNALITAEPAAPWVQLAGGWHDADGITFGGTQELNFQEVENETMPVDAFRDKEMWTISMMMKDMQLEAFSWAVHGSISSIVSVAATSSVIGTKAVGLERGSVVHKIAVLVRGDTPYVDGVRSNFYSPRAIVSSDFETTLMLADSAGVPIEFTFLKHPTISPIYIAQTHPTV